MKSKARGTDSSEVEISNIGRLGIWICVQDAEYFMDYEEFPWFKDARVKEILDVELLHGHHLHWQRDREPPRGGPLPHHRTCGSASGGSADQGRSSAE